MTTTDKQTERQIKRFLNLSPISPSIFVQIIYSYKKTTDRECHHFHPGRVKSFSMQTVSQGELFILHASSCSRHFCRLHVNKPLNSSVKYVQARHRMILCRLIVYRAAESRDIPIIRAHCRDFIQRSTKGLN